MVFRPFLLLLCFFCLRSEGTIYYIKQTNFNESRDGSEENPFSSLQEASSVLGSGEFEIVLLGESLTLDSTIQFHDSSYKISSSKENFSFIMQNEEVGISLYNSSLILERVTITVIVSAYNSQAFLGFFNSNLTLYRTTIQDCTEYELAYFLESNLVIIESQFLRLTNVHSYVYDGSLTIIGSLFVDILNENYDLFKTTSCDISFLNNTFKNFRLYDHTAFALSGNEINEISFINNTHQDSILNSGVSLISISSFGYNQIKDGLFQNISEQVVNPQGGNEPGLIIDLQDTTLTLQNITFRNIRLSSALALKSVKTNNDAISSFLKDISIENSSNVRFMCNDQSLSIENVALIEVDYNSTLVLENDVESRFYPAFYSENSENIIIKSISGKNIYGPLFGFNNVKNLEIYDCIFENSTTSQKFLQRNQRFVEIMQLAGENQDNCVSRIKNFNVSGYTYIEGSNDKMEILFTSLIYLNAESGKLQIENSRWYNINMICVWGEHFKLFEMSNMTIDADPSTPSNLASNRRIFQFSSGREIKLKNSQILNNQNINLMGLSNNENLDPANLENSIIISFENVTVVNNTAIFSEQENILPTLIDFVMIADPIIFTCQTSVFRNNKIRTSILLVQESTKLDMKFINNTFQDNLSGGSGTIFSATFMQTNVNTFEIIGNTFMSNVCSGNGGLFSFISSKYNITSANNTYKSISAGESGGIGYVSNTQLSFSERNSIIIDTSAAKFGGSWYFSITKNLQEINAISFLSTSFTRSKALQKGGVFYLDQANLIVMSCHFQENKALESGGDIFVFRFSSLSVENTIFTRSSALNGPWVYAEDASNENFAFKNIKVNNIKADSPSETLLMVFKYGTLSLFDSQFENILIPMFGFTEAKVSFQGLELYRITCDSFSQPFCIFGGIVNSFTVLNSRINNIVSDKDLISLTSQEDVTIQGAQFVNLTMGNDQSDQLFAINLASPKNVLLRDLKFFNLSFSAIKVKQSNLLINNTIFSNVTSSQRTLQQSTISQSRNIRFVVIDSSNSSILNSTFLGGLIDNNLNRGGIQILGDRGTHYISGCKFEGNLATNGGALSLEGIINSLELVDCEFTNNQALTNGGCIFFNDQNVLSFIKVNKSQFRNNRAQRGGCLFLGGQGGLIEGSRFEQNVAEEGGAIASIVENDQTRIIASKSFFSKNVALIGPTIMAFGYINFDFQDSTILSDNTAKYGTYISAQAQIIRLKVYEFEETFLYLDNATPQTILAHNETKLLFDSEEAKADILLTQKTGVVPNYIFVFTLLDQLKNEVITKGSSQLKISIKDSIFEGNTQPSLLGKTVYDFQEYSGTLSLYKAFSIRGSINTTMTLSAEVTFTDVLNLQPKTLPSFDWKAQIVSCSQGEIYDPVNVICLPCSEEAFSFEDPFMADSCQECSGPVICKGSNVVFPQVGYWQMSKGSDNVIKCFNKDACLGGEKDDGTDFSYTGFCKDGYEGIACASCSSGFAKFGNSQTCIDCRTDALYYIKFVAFFSIQIIAIVLSARIYIKSRLSTKQQQRHTALKVTITKLVIDFIQILNITSQFTSEWPKLVNDILYYITKLIPDSSEAFSVSCFIVLVNGNNENIFFIKLFILILQHIMLLVIAIAIWAVIYKLIKRKIWKNPKFIMKMRVTSAVMIYILQPYIIKATFQLFNCQNFGSTILPSYYMVEDTNVECWGAKHLKWAIGLGLISLILWLILPSLMLAWLIKDKKRNSPEVFQKKYGLIFVGYTPSLVYWEVIVLGNKVLLIIFNVFIKKEYVKIYLGFLSLVMFYCLKVNLNPLALPELNLAEQFSLLALLFLFYSAILFLPINYNSQTIVNISLSTHFITATIFFGYCLYLLYKSVRENYIIRKKIIQFDNLPNFSNQTNQTNQINRAEKNQFTKFKAESLQALNLMSSKSPSNIDFVSPGKKRRFSLALSDGLSSSNMAINKPQMAPKVEFNFTSQQTNPQDYLEVYHRSDVARSSFASPTSFEEKNQEEKYIFTLVKRSSSKYKKIEESGFIISPGYIEKEIDIDIEMEEVEDTNNQVINNFEDEEADNDQKTNQIKTLENEKSSSKDQDDFVGTKLLE